MARVNWFAVILYLLSLFQHGMRVKKKYKNNWLLINSVLLSETLQQLEQDGKLLLQSQITSLFSLQSCSIVFFPLRYLLSDTKLLFKTHKKKPLQNNRVKVSPAICFMSFFGAVVQLHLQGKLHLCRSITSIVF